MNQDRIISLFCTIAVCVIVAVLMEACHLTYVYPPPEGDEVQLKQDSIMFGGEYVMLGNQLEPSESLETDTQSPTEQQISPDDPSVEGDDLDDAGEPARETKPLVSSTKPSPMKVKEKPKQPEQKTGPATKTEKTDKPEKTKRAPETSAADNKVRNAFGKTSGNGSGKQGTANGNSDKGALSGQPSIGGLVGYTAEYWGRPHSKWTGSVTVKVRVNTRGKVISAQAVSGKGEAWSKPEVRRSCEQESLKSAFSVPKNTTTEGVGTITWRFI